MPVQEGLLQLSLQKLKRKEVIKVCDFDDFYDEGFEDDLGEDFSEDFSEECRGGIEDDSEQECDAWCFGDDLADFAIVGGVIGYLEEEIEERKRREREMKKDQDKCHSCCGDYDPFNPPDDDPYP